MDRTVHVWASGKSESSGPIPRGRRGSFALVYAPFAVLDGVFLLVICFVGWLALDALVRGDGERLAVVVVGTILAGLFTLRGPTAVLFLPDERERIASEFDVPLRPRYLLVASTIGAVVLFVSARVEPLAPFLVFLGGMSTMVVVSARCVRRARSIRGS